MGDIPGYKRGTYLAVKNFVDVGFTPGLKSGIEGFVDGFTAHYADIFG